MKDPFEAYRKSKSYSFLGSRIGQYFIFCDMIINTETGYTDGTSKEPSKMLSAICMSVL